MCASGMDRRQWNASCVAKYLCCHSSGSRQVAAHLRVHRCRSPALPAWPRKLRFTMAVPIRRRRRDMVGASWSSVAPGDVLPAREDDGGERCCVLCENSHTRATVIFGWPLTVDGRATRAVPSLPDRRPINGFGPTAT